MIKIIPLLKESFATYKANFKNIFTMAWPILLLAIILQYCLSKMAYILSWFFYDIKGLKISSDEIFNLFSVYVVKSNFYVYIIISIITVFLINLFFLPALRRSIQKREENNVFDIKDGYGFQKKNIWKYIKVNVWMYLYFIFRLLPYIIVSAVFLFLITFIENSYIAIVLYPISLIPVLIGSLLNITRFVFYKNIFFSKDDLSAREIVRESMLLGSTNVKNVWKVIFIFIALTFVYNMIINFVIYLSEILGNYINTEYSNIFQIVIISFLSILFLTPLTSILLSKGYVKVRGDKVD